MAFHAHEPLAWHTASAATRAHERTQPVGQRPLIEITDEHPLAEEQRRGISRARLEAIWSALLHQN